MALTLNKIGITTGNTVEAYHVTQSIDAFTGNEAYDISLSGSFHMTGSTTLSGSTYLQGLGTTYQPDIVTIDPITGQLYYTSSLSLPLSVLSASHAVTASYVDLVAGPNTTINQVGSQFQISASAGFPNGNQYEVQYQTGSNELGGNGSFVHIYPSRSLQQGLSNAAKGQYSHAEGNNTYTFGTYAHSEGSQTTAFGNASHAEGNETYAGGGGSHAEGSFTSASGASSHAEGYQTYALGDSSHAEGKATTSPGDYSHAEGTQNNSIGDYSHAEGRLNNSIGDYSHAEGYDNDASGSYSHAEGRKTVSLGDYSHAEGRSTVSQGDYSHAEGFESLSSGIYSHAEGNGSEAGGDYSHAEGYFTIVTAGGDNGHAEGYQTQVIGQAGHSEGYLTTASNYAHAQGVSTYAQGVGSFAGGIGTIAAGAYQSTLGKYNVSDNGANTLLIIGNGTSTSVRSTAFKVKTDPGSGVGSIVIQTGSMGSINPSWTGEEGEIVPIYSSFSLEYSLFVYIGGQWRSASLG
jgi:hypothetical protein